MGLIAPAYSSSRKLPVGGGHNAVPRFTSHARCGAVRRRRRFGDETELDKSQIARGFCRKSWNGRAQFKGRQRGGEYPIQKASFSTGEKREQQQTEGDGETWEGGRGECKRPA